MLEDVGKILNENVVDYLDCYKLDKPSSNYFFLVGSNMKER